MASTSLGHETPFDSFDLEEDPYAWASCIEDLTDDWRGILPRPPRVSVCPPRRYSTRRHNKKTGKLVTFTPPCLKFFCGCRTDDLDTYRAQLATIFGPLDRVFVARYRVTLEKKDRDARRARKRIADRSGLGGSFQRFTLSDGWEYVLATVDVSRPGAAPTAGVWASGESAVTLASLLVNRAIQGKPRGSWQLEDVPRPAGDSNNADLGPMPMDEDVRAELGRRLNERFDVDVVNGTYLPVEKADAVRLAWAEEYADLTTLVW